MKIKNIAWKEVDGADYGVAHNEEGDCVGSVRVFKRGEGYDLVAFSDYNFRCSQRVARVALSSGVQDVRKSAEDELIALLEAA